MNCEYIYKSGKNKGQLCSKQNCHLHNKKESKIIKKEDFEQTEDKYNLYTYALLIKNEFEFIYNNKIPLNIDFIKKNEIKKCLINKIINSGYETQCYIMYKFKKLKGNTYNEFEQILLPISNYENLDSMLYCMNDSEFLISFADIKTTF